MQDLRLGWQLQGPNGSDTSIAKRPQGSYPQNNNRDAMINNYALPILDQEVVQQQSASIDTISAATVTTDGYLQSLQSAIDQAHL